MPQHILDKLNSIREDLEFEESVLNGSFFAEYLKPLD